MTFEELRDKKIRPIFEKISKELTEKIINHEILDETNSDAFGSDIQLRMIFPDHGDYDGFDNFDHPAISFIRHYERGTLIVHTVRFQNIGPIAEYDLNEVTEDIIENHINNFLNEHILNQ